MEQIKLRSRISGKRLHNPLLGGQKGDLRKQEREASRGGQRLAAAPRVYITWTDLLAAGIGKLNER